MPNFYDTEDRNQQYHDFYAADGEDGQYDGKVYGTQTARKLVEQYSHLLSPDEKNSLKNWATKLTYSHGGMDYNEFSILRRKIKAEATDSDNSDIAWGDYPPTDLSVQRQYHLNSFDKNKYTDENKANEKLSHVLKRYDYALSDLETTGLTNWGSKIAKDGITDEEYKQFLTKIEREVYDRDDSWGYTNPTHDQSEKTIQLLIGKRANDLQDDEEAGLKKWGIQNVIHADGTINKNDTHYKQFLKKIDNEANDTNGTWQSK
jgi:hypothetical protein